MEKSELLNCSIWGEKINQIDNHRHTLELQLELSFIADVKVKCSRGQIQFGLFTVLT